MSFRIYDAELAYESEALKSSFNFKGNALTCLWQTAVRLKSAKHEGIGLGVQSVLWSDAAVYARLGEEKGNAAMYRLTQYALNLLKNAEIETPHQAIAGALPELYDYAKRIVDAPQLRKTFVLNALVPVDLALWQLCCKENEKKSFDSISSFDGERQEKLLNIPLITYHTTREEILGLVQGGASLLKIKIGANPRQNNDPQEMLEWDKNRILEIHQAVKEIETPHTESRKILYYLDANGRYDCKDRLLALLDFADKNGLLERIALLEEPFDESNKTCVHDLPVNLAADESAHSVEDVEERCELGYKALALKPIAKTLSITVQMAECARRYGMQSFCADLTVNPVMVSWNQCVAARLHPICGMKIGILESNGAQNYRRWNAMLDYHPEKNCVFTRCENSVFSLDNYFYARSGGIFEAPTHYTDLIDKGKI